MVTKIHDGANWKNINGLKLHNGTAWKNATKGWIWNGSLWKQWYPEYPINTAAPTVSGSTTQGNTLSCTTGSWNSNLAYTPTTYLYQWLRAGSNISGATSSTYTTVVADVGNAITCRVTGRNNRGDTSATSSNSITIVSAIPGPPTSLSVSNATDIPSDFTVSTSSTSGNGTTASGSWTASANFTSYTASTSAGTISADTSARTFSISGGTSGNSYTVTITANNTNGKITASWAAPTTGGAATGYDVYLGSTLLVQNLAQTSYTYTIGSTGTYTINVYARNAAGTSSSAASGSASISAQSRQKQASSTFRLLTPSIGTAPSASSITTNSATLSWGSTNQYTYSLSNPSTSGSTQQSVSLTGLSAGTTYNGTLTITSETGQSTSTNGSYSFTTTAPNLTAPTITSATYSGGTLSVSFSGGSGPWYQIWYQSGSDYSTVTGYDAQGTSSPITYTTSLTGTWNVAVRSASAANNTGTGPSSSLSSWSTPVSFTASSGGSSVGTTSFVSITADGCPGTGLLFTPATNATCYDFYWNNSTSGPTASTAPDYSCYSATVSGSNRYVYISGINGAKYWWVRGKDGSGNTGAWSSYMLASTTGAC